jgi:hypothetical protein
MVSEDILQGYSCQVHPSGVGGKAEAQYVFGIAGKFHPANLG